MVSKAEVYFKHSLEENRHVIWYEHQACTFLKRWHARTSDCSFLSSIWPRIHPFTVLRCTFRLHTCPSVSSENLERLPICQFEEAHKRTPLHPIQPNRAIPLYSRSHSATLHKQRDLSSDGIYLCGSEKAEATRGWACCSTDRRVSRNPAAVDFIHQHIAFALR